MTYNKGISTIAQWLADGAKYPAVKEERLSEEYWLQPQLQMNKDIKDVMHKANRQRPEKKPTN
jgi:hypothetical protein